MIQYKGQNIVVSSNIEYTNTLTVGHCSIIGGTDTDCPVKIGENLIVGAFSIIEPGVQIGSNCEISHNCIVYTNVVIGDNVKILDGSRIYSNTIIGNGSIINGGVSERTIIGENVRFFGRIAHSHRNHTLDWDNTNEPSPVFKTGSFIGINALIIGNICIGQNSYIAAGEIVRFNIPDNMVFYKGKLFNKERFREFIV